METIEKILNALSNLVTGLPAHLKVILIISIVLCICITLILLKIVDPVKKTNTELLKFLKETISNQRNLLKGLSSYENNNKEFHSETLEERLNNIEKAIRKYDKHKKKKKSNLNFIAYPIFPELFISSLPILITSKYAHSLYLNKKLIDYVEFEIDSFKTSSLLINDTSAINFLLSKVYNLNLLYQFESSILNARNIKHKYDLVTPFLLEKINNIAIDFNQILEFSNILVVRGNQICNLRDCEKEYFVSENIIFKVSNTHFDYIKMDTCYLSTYEPQNYGVSVQNESSELIEYHKPFVYIIDFKRINSPDEITKDFETFDLGRKIFVFCDIDYCINDDSFYMIKIDDNFQLQPAFIDIANNSRCLICELIVSKEYEITLDEYKVNIKVDDFINNGLKLDWKINKYAQHAI